MVSLKRSDLLSDLPECLLILIISLLPLKESVQASVLSKTWRNLHRERTNLVIKESEFVNLSLFDKKAINLEGGSFVRNIREWISRFTGEFIESFELYLYKPVDFVANITSLIEFAASRRVKNLVLDFSCPDSRKIGVEEHLQTLLRYHQDNELDIPRIVFNLIYVKNLTICSFFLQMIQDGDDPVVLHDPMKTRHLVMKTNLHTNEFEGISIFFNICPELESLTFHMVTTELIMRKSWLFDPEGYWLANKTYKCLEKTLKVVEVKNFRGSSNELHVLHYLIRNGCVMERLDLYEAADLDHEQKKLVLAGVKMFQQDIKRASKNLKITLYKMLE